MSDRGLTATMTLPCNDRHQHCRGPIGIQAEGGHCHRRYLHHPNDEGHHGEGAEDAEGRDNGESDNLLGSLLEVPLVLLVEIACLNVIPKRTAGKHLNTRDTENGGGGGGGREREREREREMRLARRTGNG